MANFVDGYAGLFLVPLVGTPQAIINKNNCIFSVLEHIDTKGQDIISVADCDITCSIISGTVSIAVVEKKRSSIPAENVIIFPKNPDKIFEEPHDWWQYLKNLTINFKYQSTTLESYYFSDFHEPPYSPDEVLIPLSNTPNRLFKLLINLRNKIINRSNGNFYAKINSQNSILIFTRTGGSDKNLIEIQFVQNPPNPPSSLMTFRHKTFVGGSNADITWKMAGAFTLTTAMISGVQVLTSWTGPNEYYERFSIPNIDRSIWDFKLTFLNPDMIPAKTSSGEVVQLVVSGIEFNGIDDLNEYAEVTGLYCSNASDPQGGDGGNNYAILGEGNIAVLHWDDMQTLTTLRNHPLGAIALHDNNWYETYYPGVYCGDVNGGPVVSGLQLYQKSIASSQLQCISHYAVFMFTSYGLTSEGHVLSPEKKFPTHNDFNGDWCLVGYTTDNTMTVPVIPNKYIAFWVGFATTQTLDKTEGTLPFEKELPIK